MPAAASINSRVAPSDKPGGGPVPVPGAPAGGQGRRRSCDARQRAALPPVCLPPVLSAPSRVCSGPGGTPSAPLPAPLAVATALQALSPPQMLITPVTALGDHTEDPAVLAWPHAGQGGGWRGAQQVSGRARSPEASLLWVGACEPAGRQSGRQPGPEPTVTSPRGPSSPSQPSCHPHRGPAGVTGLLPSTPAAALPPPRDQATDPVGVLQGTAWARPQLYHRALCRFARVPFLSFPF